MTNVPNPEQWKTLLKAATDFQETAPWKWVDEGTFFGVKDPENKEIYYCCILGNTEDHYTLLAYRGTAGLHSYAALRDNLYGQDAFTTYYQQDCLVAAFENKDYLDEIDLKILDHGTIDKEAQQCPQFRSMQPHTVPWYLEAEEADILAYMLVASKSIAQLYEKDKATLEGETDEMIPIFDVNEKGEIEREFTRVEGYMPKGLNYELSDEELVQKLVELPKNEEVVWTVRSFMGSTPVKTEARPLFPMLVLWFNETEDQVMHVEAVKNLETDAVSVLQNTVGMLEHMGSKPSKILLTEPQMLIIMGKVLQQIGVEVELQGENPKIEAVIEQFREHFSGQDDGQEK